MKRDDVHIEPRLLRKSKAAEYLGVSLSTLNELIAVGTLPQPLEFSDHCLRLDKKAVDLALDKLSSIPLPHSNPDLSEWINKLK